MFGLFERAGGDLVVGLGGGKTLDAAKAVAHLAGVPAIMVPDFGFHPTRPVVRCAWFMTRRWSFARADFYCRTIRMRCLVDTQVIAQAPARFLAAGMGDALATWFEAESCRISRAPNIAGDVGSMTAYALARPLLGHHTGLRDHGPGILHGRGRHPGPGAGGGGQYPVERAGL